MRTDDWWDDYEEDEEDEEDLWGEDDWEDSNDEGL